MTIMKKGALLRFRYMQKITGFGSVLLLALVVISCGAMRPGSSNSVEVQLLETYQEWKGTPYVLGGFSQSGIDCSGFVKRTMEETFGVEMPRTTQEQMSLGTRIGKRSLRTGDLVFFETGPQAYHVGIMVGTHRFIHAGYSSGVSLDRIDYDYWDDRYYTGRRVI